MIKFNLKKAPKLKTSKKVTITNKPTIALKSDTARRSSNEIPTGDFKTIVQYCMTCDEVTPQLKSNKNNVLHCIICEGAITF